MPLVVLRSPERLFDSRIAPPSIGGGKLAVGNSVAVTVVTDLPANQILAAAFLNVTITETEGAGFLVIRPSDLSGEVPLPPPRTSTGRRRADPGEPRADRHRWGERSRGARRRGAGRTHFVVDLQGYIPLTF